MGKSSIYRERARSILREYLGTPLEENGFVEKRPLRWKRKFAGESLSVVWARPGQYEDQRAQFRLQFEVGTRKWVSPWFVHCDSMTQAKAFAEEGYDPLAKELLKPLGLYEAYLGWVTKLGGTPFSVTIGRKKGADLQALRRRTQWSHRYAWGSPDEFAHEIHQAAVRVVDFLDGEETNPFQDEVFVGEEL